MSKNEKLVVVDRKNEAKRRAREIEKSLDKHHTDAVQKKALAAFVESFNGTREAAFSMKPKDVLRYTRIIEELTCHPERIRLSDLAAMDSFFGEHDLAYIVVDTSDVDISVEGKKKKEIARAFLGVHFMPGGVALNNYLYGDDKLPPFDVNEGCNYFNPANAKRSASTRHKRLLDSAAATVCRFEIGKIKNL